MPFAVFRSGSEVSETYRAEGSAKKLAGSKTKIHGETAVPKGGPKDLVREAKLQQESTQEHPSFGMPLGNSSEGRYSGWSRNRTRTRKQYRRNHLPRTQSRTRTAGTILQEPQQEALLKYKAKPCL